VKTNTTLDALIDIFVVKKPIKNIFSHLIIGESPRLHVKYEILKYHMREKNDLNYHGW
jgi:hypothetical protein